jgi:cell division protein FtsQ
MNSPDDNSTPPPGRSWRDIRQEVKPLAMSLKGRRRRLAAGFKVVALIALAAASGWGIYELAHSWSTDRAALATAVHSEHVKDVVVITDGVLTREWVNDVLALPKPASLMALQLPALRDKLLASGQVRVAVLTRNFPDTLVVTLQERTPVARVQAADGTGVKQLLVSKEGIVYDGVNYDKTMLESLPWLADVRLVKSDHGFEPVEGMGDVSALLSTAQLNAPQLYRDWLIVSLGRLAERDEIIVKSQDVAEIVFSRKRDYFKQIAQLSYVIDQTKQVDPAPLLQSVNLSLEGQVPVKLQTAIGAPGALTGKTPVFPIQPSQRKTKREL